MKKLIIIDIVGLTKNDLNSVKLDNLSQIFENGFNTTMIPSFPAVTCSVQATMLSGYFPSEHGIISNGFYDRNTMQVSFWSQENNLVEKPRIWDILKSFNPNLKIAVLFWQNSLYINTDIVITPKPIHLDDQMIMWCYSKPVNFYEEIVEDLEEFNLQWYWGPFTSIRSSQWICDATKYTIEKHKPDLLLVYFPHLDYAAQKYGPQSDEYKKSLIELDELVGNFVMFLNSKNFDAEYELMIISEYGFNKVNNSLSPNIILRDEGFISTRKIHGKDYIDFELSKAFAMVDHQIAHIFVKPGYEQKTLSVFKNTEGIGEILDKNTKLNMKINHPKSGELILCAEKNYWFNYYWWKDEKYAPPFTFNVDIHRKPGYDPMELFFDPIKKTISQNTSLLKGSHGLINYENDDSLPIFGMSIKSSKLNCIDITQLAPTISKFFGNTHHFPNKSIL